MTKKERREFDEAIAQFDVGLATMNRALDVVLDVAKRDEPPYGEFVAEQLRPSDNAQDDMWDKTISSDEKTFDPLANLH